MDRRASLSTIFGRKKTEQKVAAKSKRSMATMVAGLDPYMGPFDFAAAAHLLRRVTFAPTYDQIKEAVADGLAATLVKVFTTESPTLPVNPDFPDDPHCAIGETWAYKPSLPNAEVWAYRQLSLFGWTMQQLLKPGISIQEKMVLFWHNHFVIGDVDDPKYVYTYSNTLRIHALGNFREFAKAISIDPAMLRYLNNNQNKASAPNENFARELLELFTVGKGDLVGPGDYTNYTEGDIKEMAKILTGWEDKGWFAQDDTPVSAKFNPEEHDDSTKQLSNRFDNAVITGAGMDEYKNLVDVIFQQEACAQYICTKLYRWFVADKIDDTIQSQVIDPMAQLMVSADYEVLPVLEALFQSDHFFSEEAYGCSIKSPIDFHIGMIRQFEMELSTDMATLYKQTVGVYYNANQLGMQYYKPPNVAGWKAYYQEPGLHRIWINSVSLPKRINFAYKGVNQGFDFEGSLFEFDPLKIVLKMEVQTDPNKVIEDFGKIFLPKPLSVGQINALKEVLIPGLPDFEWEVEYLEYASDPQNENLAGPVRNRIRKMLTVMTSMAEYHLM